MTKQRENRFLTISEVRAEEKDGKMSVGGYAAVFEVETVIYDLFREKIARGAFADSIKNDDVRALWSHNMDFVLGRTKNNTLSLREDDHGLAFDLELPDTQLGRDAFTSIKRGDVDGMSIGFQTITHEWTRGTEKELHLRTVRAAKLFEVSPVAFPAYTETQVSARAAVEAVVKEAETVWAEQQKEWQDKIAYKRERLGAADIKARRSLLNFRIK